MQSDSENSPRGCQETVASEKRYFGKQIKVTTEGELRQPAAFQIDATWHHIDEIIFAWTDSGFGNRQGRRPPRWWRRHHRNYYRIKTTEDETFEIYYDRGTSLENPEYRRWYVTRKL